MVQEFRGKYFIYVENYLENRRISATIAAAPPPFRGRAQMKRGAASVGGRQPAHDEFDLAVCAFAPKLDLGHVRGFGIAIEQFARLGAGQRARQAEGLAPPRIRFRFAVRAPGAPLGDALGEVAWVLAVDHNAPLLAA